mmetsp:Transcript_17848/g.45025  ORF Transcript_17848/g.45025 Transcript_17848/m.45025 type:complete len:114 (+) Transcript_17848:1059-1400(+)
MEVLVWAATAALGRLRGASRCVGPAGAVHCVLWPRSGTRCQDWKATEGGAVWRQCMAQHRAGCGQLRQHRAAAAWQPGGRGEALALCQKMCLLPAAMMRVARAVVEGMLWLLL